MCGMAVDVTEILSNRGSSRRCHAGVQHLLPIMERFVADLTKWVRQAMCQHLGAFLSTLPPAQVCAVHLPAQGGARTWRR